MFPTRFLLLLLLFAVAEGAACRSDPAASKAQHVARGDAYLAEKKLNEAIIEYRNAVRLDPLSGEIRSKLGNAYLQNQDIRNAFLEYVRAADLMPENVEAQLKAGQALLLAGQFEDAKGRADKALVADPNSVAAQILRGNALAGLKDLDGAISQIENAIKTDPSQSAGYSSLGALLQFAKGDTVQAEAAFKKAVALDPKGVSARLALAGFYWASGKRAEAERAFAETLNIEPRNLLSNRALAMFYLGSGRTVEAEGPLKIIAEDMPGPDGKFALADYYAAARRLPEANTILQQLVADPAASAKARLRLAAVALLQGDRPTALRLVDEVLAKQPKHAEALIGKALLQASDGKATEAVTTMQTAVAAAPESPAAHFVLAKMLNIGGQREEALAEYREALRLNPKFAQAELELARLSLESFKYEDAVHFAEGAINIVPGYAEAHLILAQALIAKGDTAPAERPLKVLTDSFAQVPGVQAEVGRLMLAKGDLSGARASFERALGRDPAHLAALEGLTYIDLQQKRRESARSRVDAAVKAFPQNANLLVVAARQYVALQDEGAAERSLKQALTSDAKNLRAYDLLARLYVKQRRLDEATTEFQKVASLRPRDVAPHTAVAILQQLQNRWEDAEASYRKVLELDPQAAVAANNLAQMYADRDGDLDLALQLAQTAKAALPNTSEVDDTLGYIYYKKKLSSVAIASLRMSVAAQPNNPIYLYHLGLAYAQNGDTSLARESLEKALKSQANFEGAEDARRLLTSLKG